MPFTDPRTNLPKDGSRCQFKVTGDPSITGVAEPTIGTFKAPDSGYRGDAGFMGTFVDEVTKHGFHVWGAHEYEVSAWRPIDEFLAELH